MQISLLLDAFHSKRRRSHSRLSVDVGQTGGASFPMDGDCGAARKSDKKFTKTNVSAFRNFYKRSNKPQKSASVAPEAAETGSGPRKIRGAPVWAQPIVGDCRGPSGGGLAAPSGCSVKPAGVAPLRASRSRGDISNRWRGVPPAAQTVAKPCSAGSRNACTGVRCPTGATPPMANPVIRRIVWASARSTARRPAGRRARHRHDDDRR